MSSTGVDLNPLVVLGGLLTTTIPMISFVCGQVD